jgi:predicted  nucleic acid-binding Zn-ribbon protein
LSAPADRQAYQELELLVRNLGEEIASFRRRAQAAEARLQAIATKGGGGDAAAEERVSQLEAENAELRTRLAAATERTGKVLDRVRFLRQQHEEGAR